MDPGLIDPFADDAPAPKPAPTSERIRHIERPAPPKPAASKVTVERIGLAAALIVALILGFALWSKEHGGTPSDNTFVAVGRAYRADLADAYGRAWDDGAKLLEAGQPPKAALDTVAASFQANRLETFRAAIKPALNKVIEDGKDPKTITADELKAYAKAFRGLAKGLKK